MSTAITLHQKSGMAALLSAALMGLAGCAGPYQAYPTYPAEQAQAAPQSYPYAQPQSTQDYRRRRDERLYEVPVTSVRAVMGDSGQRCWMEPQEVAPYRSASNMPGAITGAVIGGILGHQIGGGSGRNLATVGGAVAGAAIGSQIGRDNTGYGSYTQDVQRCSNVTGRRPADYWDVTYDYRGTEHRVQLSSPPGRTITVNEYGEPRE